MTAGQSELIAFAARRQRAAADPLASAWVRANAGTGKTKALTDRVLNLLLAGAAPEKILCLTFTRAAAAEMSGRLADALSKWAVMADADLAKRLEALSGRAPAPGSLPGARRLFARLLDTPGGMKIQTIHGFCQALLRRFPLEAGVAPHFAVAEEADARLLMREARDRILSAVDANAGSALTDALTTVAGHVREDGFATLMDRLAGMRGKLARALAGGSPAARERLGKRLGLAPGETVDSVTRQACLDASLPDLETLARALEQGGKSDVRDAGRIRTFLNAPQAERPGLWDDYILVYLTKEHEPRQAFPSKAARKAHPHSAAIAEAEGERAARVQNRRKACAAFEASSALITIADALMTAYEERKTSLGKLDYDDLILASRRLLSDSEAAQWALYKLDGGVDHVLIDEAQDTNPDQWAVVKGLVGDFFAGESREGPVRTLFAVGDRKQSIFSFQGADPAEFDAARHLFKRRVPAARRRFEDVTLSVSFRSAPAVLQAVDAVFGEDAARDGVAEEDETTAHLAFRAGHAGLVEVWPPLAARSPDPAPPWTPPVERRGHDSPQTRMARLVAKRIGRMVAGEERLESRDRPIRPGDILVLVRRRGGFVEDLVRELKRAGAPVAGVDRMALSEQLAVMDLIALGKALLLPEDDLTLAAVLKGPILGLSEEALFALAHRRPRGTTLWRALREAAARPGCARAAFQSLSGLMNKTDFLPPHELFAHILGPLGGRTKLLARLGPDAADPIDEFLAQTLDWDRARPPSLQAFLHAMETTEREIKRDLEDGGESVRVMTVHGAKGLQAPVVFLPDTRHHPRRWTNAVVWEETGGDPPSMLWIPPRAPDRDPASAKALEAAKRREAQEYRRLLYVAMTRAEDRLYVCGWDGAKAPPEECWHGLVERALKKIAVRTVDPFLAEMKLGEGAVLRLTCAQTVAPVRTEAGPRADPPEDRFPQWAVTPAAAEPAPPRPLAPSTPPLSEPAARSPLEDPERFTRGRLAHRLLQSLPGLAPQARRPAVEAFLASAAPELAPESGRALVEETLRVLEDPAFAALFAPGSLAEVPVIAVVGTHVVSGRIDRLCVTDSDVLIADYKTDRSPPRSAEGVDDAYVAQLALYREALREVYPDRPIRCALVWTDGPVLMELPEERLDEGVTLALGGA